MENIRIKSMMIKNYNKLASTHNYILGIKEKGVWYACFVNNATDLLHKITVHAPASKSHGGGNTLRFMPTKETRELVRSVSEKVDELCSVKYMDELNETYKGNRGNIFEELVANKYNGKLADSKTACFTKSGDVNINGIEYQCKIERATWTTESTLLHLLGTK